MSEPLTTAGTVELAVVERSGFIESRHSGIALVVDPDGTALLEHGEVDALIYPRSTLKFFQAVTVLDLGAPLDGEELVLAAASHPATPRHVAVVERILERAGLTGEHLTCPVEWPGDAAARHAAPGPSRLAMNCSGKHAAFLLASQIQGWPRESVLSPAHPLQQAIRRTVETLTGEQIAHTGVDGCGAPVHALSLRALARGVSAVTRDRNGDEPAARLARAIREHPWALDSPAVATVMSETGLVAKNGAEGVFVATTPDGLTVAVSMLDGSNRATIAVALRLLARVGALDADLAADLTMRCTDAVLGGGVRVGELRAVV